MNTMHKQTLLAAVLVGALAFTTASAPAAESSALVESSAPPPYWPGTVGAGVGTDGIFCVAGSWRFSDHLGMRLGVNGAGASFGNVGIAGINYNATMRFLSEPLTLDVYPWQKSSFHVSLGMMFNQNQLTGTATASGNNGVLPGGVGLLNMKVEQQLVNPYLSIGGNLFYFDHAHHWALVGEMGVAYTGNAEVSLGHSGPANPAITAAENKLQRYADQFTWWPVVKLGVSYSF
jgi:hypothetical protein